jgi:UDP-GlcNAc3NAcA epimerase
MKTIVSIVGARPQFVKAATILRVLAKTSGVRSVLVHTGQHADPNMSDIFFDDLDLAPADINLGVSGGGHADMTGRMLCALEPHFLSLQPDAVIVYGDTNSTLAGALTAAKLGMPVAHVEAGLRSGNRQMPEEINRVLVDRLSRWLFCPTPAAVEHLTAEGITAGVQQVGDVMFEALLQASGPALERSRVIERLGLTGIAYAVATVHRAGTTDDAGELARVVAYLRRRAADGPLVMPLHPRTANAITAHGLETDPIRIVDPLGYLDMIRLLQGASEILTDSGGVQKEAYFLRKPCVTLRTETEWTETIDAGWNRLWTEPTYRPRREIDAFGRGDAAARICQTLLADLA